MLQALLEDRFKLKIRHATKEERVYALTPSKRGLKLERTKEGCPAVEPQHFSTLEAPVTRPDATICGNVSVQAAGASLTMEGHGVAGVIFAQALSHFVDRPVIDKTGFTGRFELRLEFAREEASSIEGGPSIFDALEQQLGLKLVADRAPVAYLIVDHVEKLSHLY
jgi:uncharacterized protein (TIGR03435 family)